MFIALIEQFGGCDYTIGCGKAWVYLDFSTREEALAHLKGMVIGTDNETDEERNSYERTFRRDSDKFLESVTLLEVQGKGEINLEKWYEEEAVRTKRELEELQRTSRQMQYELLKKEFGE